MTTTPPASTPLQELNNEFRRQYTKARENFWRSETGNGSVIIGKGSSLKLIHKGKEYPELKAIPQVYHDLKSIAHIPVTICIFLNNNSSISTDDDVLKKYLEQLINLEVPNSIKADEKPSVDRIITASKNLLQKEISNKGSVAINELRQFCEDLRDDFIVLLNAAAISQLNEMHTIIQGWINEHNIDPKDSSFKVLLIGARTARQNNLQTTYFEHLLGVERKRYIAYIEEQFDNESKKPLQFFQLGFLMKN
jgi:hypothetical protein